MSEGKDRWVWEQEDEESLIPRAHQDPPAFGTSYQPFVHHIAANGSEFLLISFNHAKAEPLHSDFIIIAPLDVQLLCAARQPPALIGSPNGRLTCGNSKTNWCTIVKPSAHSSS